MSERGNRRRLSDAGLFFVTLLITLAMCALWVAASADAAEPTYEYACHEGNYALPGILAGTREDEKRKLQAGAPTSEGK